MRTQMPAQPASISGTVANCTHAKILGTLGSHCWPVSKISDFMSNRDYTSTIRLLVITLDQKREAMYAANRELSLLDAYTSILRKELDMLRHECGEVLEVE